MKILFRNPEVQFLHLEGYFKVVVVRAMVPVNVVLPDVDPGNTRERLRAAFRR